MFETHISSDNGSLYVSVVSYSSKINVNLVGFFQIITGRHVMTNIRFKTAANTKSISCRHAVIVRCVFVVSFDSVYDRGTVHCFSTMERHVCPKHSFNA